MVNNFCIAFQKHLLNFKLIHRQQLCQFKFIVHTLLIPIENAHVLPVTLKLYEVPQTTRVTLELLTKLMMSLNLGWGPSAVAEIGQWQNPAVAKCGNFFFCCFFATICHWSNWNLPLQKIEICHGRTSVKNDSCLGYTALTRETQVQVPVEEPRNRPRTTPSSIA